AGRRAPAHKGLRRVHRALRSTPAPPPPACGRGTRSPDGELAGTRVGRPPVILRPHRNPCKGGAFVVLRRRGDSHADDRARAAANSALPAAPAAGRGPLPP